MRCTSGSTPRSAQRWRRRGASVRSDLDARARGGGTRRRPPRRGREPRRHRGAVPERAVVLLRRAHVGAGQAGMTARSAIARYRRPVSRRGTARRARRHPRRRRLRHPADEHRPVLGHDDVQPRGSVERSPARASTAPVEFLLEFVAHAKFYSLFSLLFGVGFAIFLERARGARRRPACASSGAGSPGCSSSG